MKKDNYYAVNIIGNDSKIINKDGTSYIFYWDGTQSLVDSLKDNEGLIMTVDTDCGISDYISGRMNAVSISVETEKWEQVSVPLQELIPLSRLGKLSVKIILERFYALYKRVFGYDFTTDDSLSVEKNIYGVFNKIREGYPKRDISKETVINYIMSEVKKNYGLIPENIMHINVLITKILIDL